MRLAPLAVALALVAGCGHDSGSQNLDLSTAGGDEDMALGGGGSGGGGGAGDDLAGGPSDLGSGGPADFANETCVPSGSVAVVSPQTRPRMTLPQAANNGTATMILWSIFPGNSFQKAVWAEQQNGAVIGSGDLPFTNDTGNTRLFAFQSAFYAYQSGAKKLYEFDGTTNTWSAVLTGIDGVAAGTTKILALTGRAPSGNATSAIFWDGASATSAAQISANSFIGLASDDAGGFGVVTLGSGGALKFVTWDGNTWSAESSIGTVTIPLGQNLSSVTLAHTGSLWAFDYGFLGNNWTAWVGSGASWASTSPASGNIAAVVANNDAFAISAADGKVYLYQSGSWSSTQIGSGGAIDPSWLGAYGSGFVYLNATLGGTLRSWIYDGSQWSAPTDVVPGPMSLVQWLTVGISGSTIAVGMNLNTAVIYNGTSWGAASTLTTAMPVNVGGMAFSLVGSDVVAVYPEPGAMKTRTRSSGSWGSALALPSSPSSGPVNNGAIGRARNGHALGVWTQWDAGQVFTYASEYDGCAWQTPVLLTGTYAGQLAIAGNQSTFLITSHNGGPTYLSRWTGSGATTPAVFGAGHVYVTSDGTTFVAAWPDAGGNIVASTSADGQTWTTAQQIDAGPGLSVSDLVGGAGGVLALSVINSSMMPAAHARLWQSGTWSAATSLTVAYPFSCKAAVGDTTALALCSGATTSDAALFAANAWSDVPLSAGISYIAPYSALATDGVDYRVDYGALQPWTAVLHAGAWSTPAQGQFINQSTMLGLAGKAGAWTLAAATGSSMIVSRASGSATYTIAGTMTLSPTSGVVYDGGIGNRWPGASDVYWVSESAIWKSVLVFYAGLGL